MMERRLQKKFEWTELPAVLAEGLLRLHGAGVELAESVCVSFEEQVFKNYDLFHAQSLDTGHGAHARSWRANRDVDVRR